MDASLFSTHLDRHLTKLTRRWAPQVAIRAPHLGIDYTFGDTGLPFHAASAGKLVTTALVMQLCEEGALTTATPVIDVLGADALRGLTPDPAGVTIEHLLTHTSGIGDYFDGTTAGGVPVSKLAVAEPDRTWTPQQLVDFTREHQSPVGRPGERFLYSDTGFVLLGLILEAATHQPLSSLVADRVARRLDLTSMFLPRISTPLSDDERLAPLFLGRTEVSGAKSLTCDWGGGGIAATATDWATFVTAFTDGRLLSPDSLAYVRQTRNRFRAGLDYGAGTMTVKVEGFAPWMRGYPRLLGHLGITSAHVWHDPVHDAAVVLNFGSTRALTPSFRALIQVLALLRRLT